MTPIVLVLDNDSSLRDLLRMVLEGAGLEVVTAATEDEARAVVAERPVDLLLLDLNLGEGGCGSVLVESWTPAGCLPPIFLVTGTPDDQRLETIEASPAFRGLWAKPFSLLDLARAATEAAAPMDEAGLEDGTTTVPVETTAGVVVEEPAAEADGRAGEVGG
ncbi:MAG: response regulator [SAR324 cluster bacterium]|nr:response regulator [SAR324 cluster bacterium]